LIVESPLSWLLHPVKVDAFFDEIWATTHHHVQRRYAGYFDNLFGSAAVEDFLEFTRSERAVVRLVKGDESLDPSTYRHVDGAIDTVRVRNEFADGHTIVLNGLERYVPAIASLAHAIEVELNFETQVNAYITPPESQGFLPHFDDHDVLILQIQGSKTWHVYEHADVPARDLRRRDAFVATELSAPSDLCLEAGDLLYLPRGRVHAAVANAEPSIHLTVGIHAPTVLTLVTQALGALSIKDDRVLARLPPRHLDDPDARGRLEGLVRDVIRAIDDPSIIADGLGAIGDTLVRRGRCRPVGQMVSNAVKLKQVDGQMLVAKYRPLYSRVLAIADGVALQFGQSLVSAGSDHRAAMLFLSKGAEPFRVREIPGLSEDQQRDLARTLIVDGFLIRLSEPTNASVDRSEDMTTRATMMRSDSA
jgi:bifunctional lysine-specific demethylase and histidyl-hydroxylase NO66